MMDLQSIESLVVGRITTDPLTDLLIGVVVLLLIQTVLLSRRIALLTRGASGASLEHTIATLGKETALLNVHAHTTEVALNNLDTRLRKAVRGVSVRRFDPFQNSGGQQSFASALVNEDGEGVVLSGIHARDGVRVYAKEVQGFASARELSDDERAAIIEAQKKL